MTANIIRALKLHYPMNQFLIKINRSFSPDVTAAILVYKTMKTAAMLVYR